MVDFNTKVTKSEFEAEAYNGKVLVDLYKDGCAPCTLLAPHVAEVDELGLKVVKINGEKNPVVASKFGIMSYPALFLLEDGEIVREALGGNNAIAYANELKGDLQ